ncbi:hypothetical protein GLOTRDRAFT_78300 [Gloeophyllum trabeum ATCC 11539]|uniref:Zn(2)-C6 fungal-type domain-containing protein n=1 Tax=Gloeophyllum trabeum (strain ATCC 11539 / FP-39264 / Madison 617) TaxID=670483 RepID=S7RIY8_GLOTA|nr:uncharacterized protein GLOTRDRAFT_78300 [Gloeophyllum trabeum ATCC 11539]EPQ54325.1 hypothetical protein GLOTRDRAFT_78300 [Gloeophyllum trabeum ATCC 11539]
MSDIARQRRSSISSPARSSKKPGAPKAKGTVRAKSGCYTCRIRRKKCDERQDQYGNCETCVRLRLQCLGFGAKRPDYLKNTKNVADFREKIKSFLASNGMIKGHSNPGTRSPDEEPTMLRLVDEHRHSSSVSSPQSESMSSPDSHDGYRSHLLTSHVRDPEPHYELSMPGDSSYPHSIHQHIHHQQLAPDSPPCPPRRLTAGDPDILNPLTMPPSMSSNSLSLVSSSPGSWHNEPAFSVAPYRSLPPPARSYATYSSFGPLYHHHPYGTEDIHENPDDYISPSPPAHTIPSMAMAPLAFPNNDLVHYYFNTVVRQQYLLADETVFHNIMEMVSGSTSAYNAACFLSSLHKQRGLESNGAFYENVKMALLRPNRTPTEGDIMAGLIVISSFLFKGGRGSWQNFLDVARNWAKQILEDQRFGGPERVLKNCSPGTRFILKTTMWFDVLASITEIRCPHLIGVYRELYARWGDSGEDDPDLSMVKPMGCDNQTFLALAETSYLAWWKESQQKQNRLSVIELIEQGRDIEKRLKPQGAAFVGTASAVDDRHRLTCNIFRASARLYLHSILSGDYPNCPEISNAVDETVQCLKAIPPDGNLLRSIVRSVVFSICICGCLTDDRAHREYLLDRLREQERVSEIGNCSTVKSVMQIVWDRRDAMNRYDGGRSGSKWQQQYPINWREVMHENNQGLLLLV